MARSIAYRWAKRIVITVVGFTVLLVGVAMTVLPGPAFVVIPIGLGILGLEFAWARVWLRKIKEKGGELAQAARNAMNNNVSNNNNNASKNDNGNDKNSPKN